jgi:hypothetical protein
MVCRFCDLHGLAKFGASLASMQYRTGRSGSPGDRLSRVQQSLTHRYNLLPNSGSPDIMQLQDPATVRRVAALTLNPRTFSAAQAKGA